MTLVTMIGFIYNDIIDIDLDRAAGKNRPISSGSLPVRSALGMIFILTTLQFLVAPALKSHDSVVILLATTVAVIAYSHFSKRLPILKGLYVACLANTPLLMGYSEARIEPNWGPMLVVFSFIFWRECLLDVYDAYYDTRRGFRTVASFIPPPLLEKMAWLGMVLSLAFGYLVLDGFIAHLVMTGALGLQLLAAHQSNYDQQNGLVTTRFVMIVGVIAACLSEQDV